MNPKILPADDRTINPGVHEGQKIGKLQLVGCSSHIIVVPSESSTLKSACLWLQQNNDLTNWLLETTEKGNDYNKSPSVKINEYANISNFPVALLQES